MDVNEELKFLEKMQKKNGGGVGLGGVRVAFGGGGRGVGLGGRGSGWM